MIGILNGTDLVDFNRKQLLTHVHVGTLGWITMSVIAASYTLFSLADQSSSRASYMRPLAIFTPIAIVGAAGWTVSRARAR